MDGWDQKTKLPYVRPYFWQLSSNIFNLDDPLNPTKNGSKKNQMNSSRQRKKPTLGDLNSLYPNLHTLNNFGFQNNHPYFCGKCKIHNQNLIIMVMIILICTWCKPLQVLNPFHPIHSWTIICASQRIFRSPQKAPFSFLLFDKNKPSTKTSSNRTKVKLGLLIWFD